MEKVKWNYESDTVFCFGTPDIFLIPRILKRKSKGVSYTRAKVDAFESGSSHMEEQKCTDVVRKCIRIV